MGLPQAFVSLHAVLQNPDAAFVMLIVGILLIYAECLAPGAILPGVAGSVMTLTAVASFAVRPLDWRGAALLCLALPLLVLEATHGAGRVWRRGWLTAAAALCTIGGAMTLIDRHAAGGRVHGVTAFCAGIPFAAVTSFLFSTAVRAHRNKALVILKVPVDARSKCSPGRIH